MDEKDKKDIDLTLEMIKKWILEMQFGSISIVVQDGKIVQTDKTEKFRQRTCYRLCCLKKFYTQFTLAV